MSRGVELHLEKELDQPFGAVLEVLRAGPQHWLPSFAEEGGRVTSELAFEHARQRVRRRVEVVLGTVQRFAYGVTVRVQWAAAQHPQFYPRLEGHLRLERREPAGCRLRFDARYVPPAGRLGASVDRALMHRVAEVSVHDFLDRTADLLVRRANAHRRTSAEQG